jgi:hypothetical protein
MAVLVRASRLAFLAFSPVRRLFGRVRILRAADDRLRV